MTVVHIERVRSVFDPIGADMPPSAAIQDGPIERAFLLLKSCTYDAEGATFHCRFDVVTENPVGEMRRARLQRSRLIGGMLGM
jgi:hypothetical protein